MHDGDGGPPHPGATAVMAGFITWLAPQHLREEHEETVLEEVDRFLHWHYTTGEHPRPGLKRSSWRYMNQLRRSGASDAEQRTIWAALQVLIAYDTQHATRWT